VKRKDAVVRRNNKILIGSFRHSMRQTTTAQNPIRIHGRISTRREIRDWSEEITRV